MVAPPAHAAPPCGEANVAPPDEDRAFRDGHRRRLREKFLRGGINAFLDHEIIEILLTLGTPRKDCRASARAALREFKTLRGVLEADARDLRKVDGIGDHNVFGVRLVQEGPTLIPALDAHVLHPEPFDTAALLPFQEAQEPSSQREALHRRRIMRRARSKSQRRQLLRELEKQYADSS